MNRIGGWLQTRHGVALYPFDLRPEDLLLEDIAYGLAGEGRFGNHCRLRYSVCQHSVTGSYFCHSSSALKFLFHDGAEAYFKDLPRPIKHMPELSAYAEAEHKCQQMIYEKFCPFGDDKEVKRVDTFMLGIEVRDMMMPLTMPKNWEWCLGPVRDHPFKITRAWSPEEAEERFLARYAELTK